VTWRASAALAAGVLALLAVGLQARAADPEAIWKVVHDTCVPAAAAGKPLPPPCLTVDATNGDAVIKSRGGPTEVLLLPTARVTGIESAVVLDAHAPNYVWDAWQARSYMIQLAGKAVPRDDLSLAVNSIDGRSQNQLHIHVDCVAQATKTALDAVKDTLGSSWTTVTLANHPYQARRFSETELQTTSIFRLIDKSSAEAAANMGLETFVVVAEDFATGPPGFILLFDRANPEAGDYASGEELMDHGCGVLAGGPGTTPAPSAH
jgi:CDP-diacylglycerol pyrophosphatase